MIVLEYLCVLKKTKGKLDGRVQINHPMVVCIVRIVMTQKKFMKEIGICERARQYYSDREHRGFGGVYVTDWSGKPGRTFRTCSCSSCSCPPRKSCLKQEYVCEDCGEKGNGCQGYFDRRSATGGLPSTMG